MRPLPLALAAALMASAPAPPVAAQAAGAGEPASAPWPTYSLDDGGQRHSPLTQITPENAGTLTAAWTFQTGIAGHKFESTPLVVGDTLYVTGPLNAAWAVDGRTGQELWEYRRKLPPLDSIRPCCGLVNRGFALRGDRLFMGTLDAHLVALDRHTGEVLWDVAMAPYTDGYSGTAAPLVVGDKVIAGIAGGEFANRGFLDAYDAADGHRVWRFWTVPEPGAPGGDTWPAEAWKRGGGPTWLTGSWDPELGLVYWGVGNPNPDFYGADREGDNLYTNALVALDPDTGELRWHFQFTPHDEHDWDANEIPVLADLTVDGRPRKVVMMANRNGFFYVLDRTDGELLRAFPFAHQTWAKPDDALRARPVELPDQRPTPEGTLTCPDLYGSTNWQSPSWDPALGLFFVTAREFCQVYVSIPPPEGYPGGERTMGGRALRGPEPAWGALRAIDPLTGKTRWEVRHDAPSWAGNLSTASGLVFSGDGDGNVLAVDARSGEVLWRYQMGAPLYSAPVTYEMGGRQYVVVAAGSVLMGFALP